MNDRVRSGAVIVATLAMLVALAMLLFVDERTRLKNVIGVIGIASVLAAILLFFRPELLAPSGKRHSRPESYVDAEESERQQPASERVPQRDPPETSPSRKDLEKLREALLSLSNDVAALRTTIVAHDRAVRDLGASITGDIQRLRAEIVEALQDSPPRVVPSTTFVPAHPEPGHTSVEDESMQTRLHQLASKCMSRGLTLRKVVEEVPADWRVDTLDASDIPDAFFIHITGGDAWVVPNTRQWFPFRERGWFDVTGVDVPSARIVQIRRFPRLDRRQRLLERGHVEISA